MNLRHFYPFPELPRELQASIWEASFPPPRIIEISASGMEPGFIASTRPHEHRVKESYCSRFGSFGARCCPPILLQVCHLSREIALASFETTLLITPSPDVRFYKMTSPHWIPNKEKDIKIRHSKIASPGIWFQPRRDTLYFSYSQTELHNVLRYLKPSEAKSDNIRSLAIDEVFLFDNTPLVWESLFGGYRDKSSLSEYDNDTLGDDDDLRETGDDRKLNPAILTGLEELIVIVKDVYFMYPFHGEDLLDGGVSFDERREQRQELILSNLQKYSTLPKLPTVIVMAWREMAQTKIWEEPPNVTSNSRLSLRRGHRKDCYRHLNNSTGEF